MQETLTQLAAEYTAALEDYLLRGEETSLRFAYELGRKAIGGEIGVLDLVSVHNQSLTNIVETTSGGEQAANMAERASLFIAEGLAAYEMALRGFRETNASLRGKIEQIQSAERELHLQNQQLVAAEQSLNAERQRYQDLFNFAPDAYFVTNVGGVIQEANAPAAELLRTSQELLVGRSLLSFVAAPDVTSVASLLAQLENRAVQSVQDWEVAIESPDGQTIPASFTVGHFQESPAGRVGLRWLLRNITERKRMESERMQLQIREYFAQAETEAAQKLRFLSEVSTALAGSLDYQSIPDIIALLSVPYFADCCLIYLVDDSMAMRHFVIAQKDQGGAELRKKLQLQMSEKDLPPPAMEVLRTGQSLIVQEISEAWLEPFATGPEEFLALRKMEIKSALIVPLLLPARRLGAITFMASASGGRAYRSGDRVLADELARRCALFLENARLYQEVVVEKNKVEKASEAKEQFVIALSHEIRTPLMAILGWARILNHQPPITGDPILSDGVRSLEHNAKTIARLVDDCLDMARIAAGKIQLHCSVVDFNAIANAAFEGTREFAYSRGLRIATQFSSSSIRVFADQTRLEQVLLNLLTNAIKFTNQGGEVSLTLQDVDGEAEFEVKDTGIGIAAEFLEQIFEPFRQGAPESYTSDSGIGLGLAIARKIVQLHGGRIWAESLGLGKGSSFRVRLPLATLTPEQDTVGMQNSSSPARSKPLRILFVEDSRDVRNLAQLELQALGYTVFTAEDANTGLEIARRELPDALVSDIKMHGVSGYQFIELFRQLPGAVSIPAIALSGFGMKADIERSLQAGFNAHLSKPVEFRELASLIEKLAPAPNP